MESHNGRWTPHSFDATGAGAPRRSEGDDDFAGQGDARRRLAEALHGLKERSNKSLKELQVDVHVSDSSLSRYLSGKIVPSWVVVERICQATGANSRPLRPLWEQARRFRYGRRATVAASVEKTVDGSQGADVPPSGGQRPRVWARAVALVIVTGLCCGLVGMWLGVRESPARATVRTGTCSAWLRP